MALHGKTEKTAKQKQHRANKPSRAKRLARRWDDRVALLREYLITRDYAFRVGPFVSRVWPRCNDVARVFRIAEYLAARAERPSNQKAKAA